MAWSLVRLRRQTLDGAKARLETSALQVSRYATRSLVRSTMYEVRAQCEVPEPYAVLRTK